MEKFCMNKTAAKEWLRIAYHDLLSAKILYDAKHFTDSIGCDIQQSIEKVFKAILASKNRKIPKSHDLIELYSYIENEIEINVMIHRLYCSQGPQNTILKSVIPIQTMNCLREKR